MEYDPQTVARKAITISGKSIEAPLVFKEGQELTLTPGLASQLNQLLHENGRNALTAMLKSSSNPLTEITQEAADDYFQKYEFGIGGAGRRQRTALEKVALEIARDLVNKRIMDEYGLTPSQYKKSPKGGTDKYNQAVAQAEALPEVISAAEQSMAVTQSYAAGTLEGVSV